MQIFYAVMKFLSMIIDGAVYLSVILKPTHALVHQFFLSLSVSRGLFSPTIFRLVREFVAGRGQLRRSNHPLNGRGASQLLRCALRRLFHFVFRDGPRELCSAVNAHPYEGGGTHAICGPGIASQVTDMGRP